MKPSRIVALVLGIVIVVMAVLLISDSGLNRSKCLQRPFDCDKFLGPHQPGVLLLDNVGISKDFEYTGQYTLDDEYPYRDTTRYFQWDKVNRMLTALINMERKGAKWGMLRNYKNYNGSAPLTAAVHRNEYNSYVDEYGVERTQAAPLYDSLGSKAPVRYGRDGSLVRYISDSLKYTIVSLLDGDEVYYVPSVYYKELAVDTIGKIIIVDRTDQNIATLERKGDDWLIRSMTYATTGLHNPPFQSPTPTGVYVIQEHREKMYYTHDGSSVIAGYAPYASRFTRGAYVHGVPLTNPNATHLVEYSRSLGTTPRSHMCVRTVTSHAEFVYGWSVAYSTLVYVFD